MASKRFRQVIRRRQKRSHELVGAPLAPIDGRCCLAPRRPAPKALPRATAHRGRHVENRMPELVRGGRPEQFRFVSELRTDADHHSLGHLRVVFADAEDRRAVAVVNVVVKVPDETDLAPVDLQPARAPGEVFRLDRPY